MLMLNVPATVGLVVLGVPIVRVIFEHGKFFRQRHLATAAALQFYAVGLVGYSVVRIVSPVFYALGRNRVPVIVSVIAVLMNAALNIMLVRVMGYRGLALGTSIAALFNAIALFVHPSPEPRRAERTAIDRFGRPHRRRVDGDGGSRLRRGPLDIDADAAAGAPVADRSRLSVTIGDRSGDTCRRCMGAPDRGVPRQHADGSASIPPAYGMKTFRPFGLHGTVVVMASTHFLVDGYGNVLTPLLPLLITNLNLSLAGAGTLQMCFQLANSVAQLGFGHLADRSNPRILLIGGPLLAVAMLPLIGLAPTAWVLAAMLIVGGLGGAAFHPPAAALVHRYAGQSSRLRDVVSHHQRHAGTGDGAAAVCAVRAAIRTGRARRGSSSPGWRCWSACCCGACRPSSACTSPELAAACGHCGHTRSRCRCCT